MPTERAINELALFPSANTSAEWNLVAPAVRNTSFFSACIEDERLLGSLQKLINNAYSEGWSVGEFLDEALHKLEAIELDRTTVKNEIYKDNFERLYNVERLRLIYLTQRELSDGYFNFQKAFSPITLKAYPAWEFHRQPGAKEENKRPDHVEHEGDIRLKTDIDYWLDRNRAEIGGFGNPYGPWGFNSWMRELPVARERAEQLGLLKKEEQLTIPARLAEWNLPQAMKQLGQSGVSDLSPEQQQRVVERCERAGIAVAQGEDNQGILRIVVNLDDMSDPLARLEEATTEAWLNEEAQRIDSMGESEWLGLLLGGFLSDKIFRKPKKKKEEKLQASKRRKQPITLPDGTYCFTEDCERHKGTTREGETPRHKRQDKPSAQQSKVLFSDSRCTVKQYADGSIVVYAHQVATAKDATESLKRLIAQCRELRKGQMRGKPDFGFIAPGEQTEFFVSGRTIGECVENKSHIARSDNKEAHLTAASIFDQLWEASQEGIRRKPKKGMPKDKQIKWVHERYAIMKTKKAFYRIKMIAFEYENKRETSLLYDINVTKIPQRAKRLL